MKRAKTDTMAVFRGRVIDLDSEPGPLPAPGTPEFAAIAEEQARHFEEIMRRPLGNRGSVIMSAETYAAFGGGLHEPAQVTRRAYPKRDRKPKPKQKRPAKPHKPRARGRK